MKFVLINQFYPPASAPTGRLLRDLARALAARGHQVTVLTSAGSYATSGSAPPSFDDPGIDVIRLGRPRAHLTSWIAKLFDYLAFYFAADRALRGLSPAPDVVICETTPPLIALVANRFGRSRHVPYCLWCMDLYPEALAANGTLRRTGWLFQWLLRLATRERRGARAVFTLGPDMTALVARDPEVRVLEIPVWSELQADEELQAAAQRLREQRGWRTDELILLYSGNMGRAHRADAFIAMARHLRDHAIPARVVFCGDGPRRAAWEKQGGDVVTFMRLEESVPLAVHLLAADVHLISQDTAWLGVVVPSKFQSACALGRPVLYAGPVESALAIWVREADAGWVMQPDASYDLALIMPDLLDAEERRQRGANARAMHQKYFTATLNLERLCTTLEHIHAHDP